MTVHRLEEGPDPSWLDIEANRRREVFNQRRAQELRARLQERKQMPLARRLGRVIAALGLLGSPSAGSISRSARGAERDGMPSTMSDMAVGYHRTEEVKRHLAGIQAHLEALELIIDQHKGLATPATTRKDISEEKNNTIRQLSEAGLSAEDIHRLDGSLGSVRVIRKVISGVPV